MQSMNDNSDIFFLKEFFRELQRENITYCILRNATEIEEGDAHDIDITIDISRIQAAEEALYRTANQHGWRLHLKTGNVKNNLDNKTCYHYFLIDEKNQLIHVVHIDVFPTINWQGIELMPNSAIISNIRSNGLFPMAARSVEATCNLFTNLLFNGHVKDKYKETIQQFFQEAPDESERMLRYFLSKEMAQHVYKLACSAQWDTINNERTKLINDIYRNARHTKWNHFRYRLAKALHRKGIVVAFQGTDGSGKSTVINGIPKLIGNSFSGDMLKYYHWRPGFIHSEKKFTPDGQLLTNVPPHTQKAHGKIKSFAKMVFYTLDYVLGYLGEVYWKAARGNLVIFDRYYYDFYMDKVRYRLSIGNRVVRFFHRFIPAPDITILLIGNAQKIFERKQELTVEEIQQQTDLLIKNQSKFANPIIIDANQSIPQVQFSVCKKILESLAIRNTPLR